MAKMITSLTPYTPTNIEINHWNLNPYDTPLLVQKDGDLYFIKETNLFLYLNAKIVEYLAHWIHLECSKTMLHQENNELYCLSQNFYTYKEGNFDLISNIFDYNYLTDAEVYSFIGGEVLRDTFYENNNLVDVGLQEFFHLFPKANKTDFLKMIALDIYTGQWDRNGSNIQINTESGDLAPLYDNDRCYLERDYLKYYDARNQKVDLYRSPFLVIAKREQSLFRLLEKYPYCLSVFQKLLESDLYKIIGQILEKDALSLSVLDLEQYLREEEKTKALLRKII